MGFLIWWYFGILGFWCFGWLLSVQVVKLVFSGDCCLNVVMDSMILQLNFDAGCYRQCFEWIVSVW